MKYLKFNTVEDAKARSAELYKIPQGNNVVTKYLLGWKVHPVTDEAVLCVDDKYLSYQNEEGETIPGILTTEEESQLLNSLDDTWTIEQEV